MTNYNTDFHAWTQEQAKFIRAGQLHQLDLENLAEEIESLGRQEWRELRNRLAVLIGDLLKWQFQPTGQGASWRATLREQRCFEVDQRNFPRLNLTHHKLLNRNPAAYFGCQIKWPAPVQVDIPTFMGQIQHPRLAPFTQKLRVLADGNLYLKAVSGAWVHVFGAKLDRHLGRLSSPCHAD